MHPFFHGLIFGLVFIFFIGPAFFALIQTSIQSGLRAAIFLAFGISFSDILYVLLTNLGISSLLDHPEFKFWISIGGAVILIGYGIYTWMKKPPTYEEVTLEDRTLLIKYWVKGFLLNGLNPFIILFWVSWVSFVSVNYNYSSYDQRFFFGGVLVTILSSDIAKAIIANKKKHLINPRWFQRLNKVVSLILILFGLRIIYFLFETFVGF